MVEWCRVRFLPDEKTVKVKKGTDLRTAAVLAGIDLRSGCGGEGTCGRCAVIVREGSVTKGEGNLSRRLRNMRCVLACRAWVEGDVVVEVLPESRLGLGTRTVESMASLGDESAADRYAFDPVARCVSVRLEEPSLESNAPDATRLMRCLKQQGLAAETGLDIEALRRLPEALRAARWNVDAICGDYGDRRAIFDVLPAGRSTVLGVAIDVGTTTVTVDLVDMKTGGFIGRRSDYNRQARYGDDVISRIIHADEGGSQNRSGLADLKEAVLETVNDLILSLAASAGFVPEDVKAAQISGNTTMSHLFLGIPPRYIRLEPYIPAANEFPVVLARELGLEIHPRAPVHTVPAVASYVGGDIVAGVLAVGMDRSDDLVLFIDIGTNGEMVLGNSEWMVGCACSAGPCFEGSGMTCGMRAMPGAIQKVVIRPEAFSTSPRDPGDVLVRTIGGAPPVGICGSGMIDALAEFWRSGVIDRSGRFSSDLKTDRLRKTDEGYEFVLVRAEDSGTGRDIVMTQGDVENLLRAKAAVFAGIRSLVSAVGVDFEDVSRIYVAGGFGNFVDLEEAVTIGLIPDAPRNKYRFVGNTSVYGSRLCLLSSEAREKAGEIARMLTYLELSVGNAFMEEFVSALFLPHTNLDLFPSVARWVESDGSTKGGAKLREAGEELDGTRDARTLAAGMD